LDGGLTREVIQRIAGLLAVRNVERADHEM